MVKERVAIRFPELERLEKYEVSIYSEASINVLERNCFEQFNAMKGITNLIAEKVRTAELSKRIELSKQALDVKLEEAEKQLEIQYQERIKRLEFQLENEKNVISNKFEKLKIETKKQMDLHSISFEEAVRKNTLIVELLNYEKSTFEMIRNDIDKLINDIDRNNKLKFLYSTDYIFLNNLYTKSLERINLYLNQLV